MIAYSEIIKYIVDNILVLGYTGIFLLMFLESSFFPFPSEIVMIPAGYLAYKGEMNLLLVIFSGILGSLSGAWFNYFLAEKYGRKTIIKFIKSQRLKKIERFFEKHGHISTFNGRLVPVVRQYISFPAGLARMNKLKFTLYTTLGAGIWILILTFIGYYIGAKEELIKIYLKEITGGLILFIVLSFGIYFALRKKQTKRHKS